MKKLNLKQPKYIFPLVIFLPLTFFAYEISTFIDKSSTPTSKVATDSLNMGLPDAATEAWKNKMAGMEEANMGRDGYSAIDGLGEEKIQNDSMGNAYSEHEMNQIDKDNAEREAQRKAQEELERSLAESRKHINAYAQGSSTGSAAKSHRDELDDYAKELEYIQKRSQAAQRAIDASYGTGTGDGQTTTTADGFKGSNQANISRQRVNRKSDDKVQTVKKVESLNAEKFHTISSEQELDAPLITAMIDKTTKAHEGTRLRFKLLDDVSINKVLLKKGTYLYGLVTGFGQQRVRANITSILVGNKFLKVNLAVYDNDGMEGFYVPESAFRDFMKEAGVQAMQQNMQFGNNYNSAAVSGEAIALQALQNIYQSASSAVSANMRKNKARIKYNTIVYLINTTANE